MTDDNVPPAPPPAWVCPATGGRHVWTGDTGPLPRWHHGSTVHCDECGAKP